MSAAADVQPRGRLVRLPSGRVAEALATDDGELEAVLLETGERVTVHARRVRWLDTGGDAR